MSIFVIQNRNLFNSDYGDVLIRGCAPRNDADGLLHLMRAGPFVPPVFIAGPGDHLLVSTTFRRTLENSGFTDIGFLPTVYDKIVNIPWHTWDLQAAEPNWYPESGEPDDYLFAEPHNEELAATMEKSWEVVLARPPCNVAGDLTNLIAELEDGFEYPELFYGSRYASRRAVPLVGTAGKKWFSENGGDWVGFREIATTRSNTVKYPDGPSR